MIGRIAIAPAAGGRNDAWTTTSGIARDLPEPERPDDPAAEPMSDETPEPPAEEPAGEPEAPAPAGLQTSPRRPSPM